MGEDDPFGALGLPARFDLGAEEVERAYLLRVASSHPDLGGVDPEAEGRAARLNEARRKLLDPEARAVALLEVLGAPSGDGSLPEGFLLEIMDARMDFERAAMEGDAEGLARWRRWAQERRREVMAEVAGHFRAHAAGDAGALGAVRRALNAWRYYERMIQQR